MRVPLPRVFGVFFNQGHASALAEDSVRSVLNVAIDKNLIVSSILHDYGIVLDGPIPPGVLRNSKPLKTADTLTASDRAQKARDILSRGGWTYEKNENVWKKKKQILSISLATSDSPELSATANKIAEFWRAAGVQVNVKIYPLSELNTNVIRPRAYDAILFGEVVGRSIDLFAFWHSSQRNDPGLNLAMYANTKADGILAEARVTTDPANRETLYTSFASIIEKDQPEIGRAHV